jgi:hypothetical protein
MGYRENGERKWAISDFGDSDEMIRRFVWSQCSRTSPWIRTRLVPLRENPDS